MFAGLCRGRVARLWYLYTGLRRSDQLAAFCLLQAVTVILVICYTIVFVPHLITDTDSRLELQRGIGGDHEPQMTDVVTKSGDMKPRRYWLQGNTHQAGDEHEFTVYRFDKLSQYDEAEETRPYITDDGEYSYFSPSVPFSTSHTPSWFLQRNVYCNDSVIVYGTGKQLVRLRRVSLYPQFSHGKVGGEDIEDVINQKAEHENIKVEKGYFVVDSPFNINVTEPLSYDLSLMYEGLLTKDSVFVPFHQRKRSDITCLIIIRHEYANFYHTTMSWYDIFLTMVLLKIDPYHLEVVWLDAHPESKLDGAWETLYGKPTRAGGLTDPVKYEHMIWVGFGPKSPINLHKAEYLPFVEAYRHFVLSRFEVEDKHVINCKELRISIIWRRDYVAHPRNPKGHIPRKMINEEEVWKAVKEADFGAIVNGVQLDRLSFDEQLELVSRTDVLIGMHGAGLSHILYLPQTSAVMELFPSYVSPGNAHFRSMAKWRRLRYTIWSNRDYNLEKGIHATEIPKSLIQSMVKTIKKSICE